MKTLNNLSIKLKLLVLTVPLIVCVIAAVIFAGVQINNMEEVTHVYYDVLYNINSSLVNADRDFYQSLLGATQYYDIVNGFSSMPESSILIMLIVFL